MLIASWYDYMHRMHPEKTDTSGWLSFAESAKARNKKQIDGWFEKCHQWQYLGGYLWMYLDQVTLLQLCPLNP